LVELFSKSSRGGSEGEKPFEERYFFFAKLFSLCLFAQRKRHQTKKSHCKTVFPALQWLFVFGTEQACLSF